MNLAELKDAADISATKWMAFVSSGKVKQARHQAQLTGSKCKGILKGKSKDRNLRSMALVFGILFRGLQDYNNLTILIGSPQWNKDHNLAAAIWELLCDCEERIEFALNYLVNPVPEFEAILSELALLELEFQGDFPLPPEFFRGYQELYASPGWEAKKVLCNICRNDFRSCSHRESWIYSGIMCQAVPSRDELFVEESLVPSGRDRRCRIWPWDIKAEKKVEVTSISGFSLDGFMYEDKPDARRVRKLWEITAE